MDKAQRYTQHISCYRTIVILAILSFGASIAPGQQSKNGRSLPVTLHGQVRLAHGGTPAENVLVKLERFGGGIEAEAMTDRTGKYQFSGMAPAIYVINVHLFGFIDQRREVDLQSVTSSYELFQLVPAPQSADSHPVTATKLIDANVPEQARIEFEKAEAALVDGQKLTDAVRHLERAVSIYPAFLQAQLRLGVAYMDLREWDKAGSALHRALEINPQTYNACFALGELYLHQNRLPEAEKALRDGLALENRSWVGHFTLGRLYWQEGEIAKAARQVALTMQLNPKHAEAHLLAGNIFLRAGKREDALAEFEEYLSLAPNGPYSGQAKEAIQKIKLALNRKT